MAEGKNWDMPNIDYLGFVIRPSAMVPQSIVAACLTKSRNAAGQSQWTTYPNGKTKFNRMLFVIAETIQRRFAQRFLRKGSLSAGEPLLQKRHEPAYAFALDYLHDVVTSATKYRSVPEGIRAVCRHFFCLRGRKENLQLETLDDGLGPDQIFFWTVEDYRKATGAPLPKSWAEVTVRQDPPTSNQDLVFGLYELAEKVRLQLAEPVPWQKLYRQSLARLTSSCCGRI